MSRGRGPTSRFEPAAPTRFWHRYTRRSATDEAAARLDEARRQEASASAVLDMADALAGAASPLEVDKALAATLNAIFGSARCLVLRWDPASAVLRNMAWMGFPEEMQDDLVRLEVRPADTPLLNLTLGSDEAVIVTRDDTEDAWAREALERFDCLTAASITVKAFDAPYSVISLHFLDAGITRETIAERLRTVAGLCRRAYENASVIQAQADRVERLGGQKQILEMVARGNDLRSILETVCLTVEAQIPSSMCAVFMVDKEGERLQSVACPNLPSDFVWEVNGTRLGPFSGSVGSAAFREHAHYAADVMTDKAWESRRAVAQKHGIKAAWAMPIFAAGGTRVLGALALYLTKKGNPEETERAFMEMAAQLTAIAIERRELENQLTHQAFHDSLTGLPNRALFADRVQHALDRQSRSNEPLAMLLLDLDDFKSVNDTLGHPAGDELLRSIADRIRRCLRSADTPARLGGDEFAILLEAADSQAAQGIAQRLLKAVQAPIRITGMELRTSASIGIALADGSKDKMQDLLRHADTAMYASKADGKGRFRVFEPHMQSGLLRRLELQSELQRAVENDEFVVHYQPIYKLKPHHMVGVEALVRWNHPMRGLMSPEEFIPVAEDSGLIVEVGALVMDKVCAQAREWARKGARKAPLRIGVNFSLNQLRDPAVVQEVATSLDRYGVPPGSIVVEITESVLLEDPDEVAATLDGLKELGVHIAIDDFGTGYSSLSYLRRFPVDILKIDRFFVQGLDAGPEEAAYGRAIVRLGHSLGLEVVAEGVETLGEFDALLDMGCDFAQGFLFSRPITADELLASPEFAGQTTG